MPDKTHISLIECINTFQGEGPDSGIRMLLCRFKRCNLVDNKIPCTWCDTLVKMRVQEELDIELNKIQKMIDKKECGIMITGGEPTYYNNLKDTINMLNNLDYPIANVETNGYNLKALINLVNGFKNVKFIYSPKVFNEDQYEEFKNVFSDVSLDQRVYFKIVAPSNYSRMVLSFLNDKKFNNNKIYIMPRGVSVDELNNSFPTVLDFAEEFNVNVTSRLHISYQIV